MLSVPIREDFVRREALHKTPMSKTGASKPKQVSIFTSSGQGNTKQQSSAPSGGVVRSEVSQYQSG
jgi:hypothetical protein